MKLIQGFVIIFCIIVKSAFVKLIGIDISIEKISITSRIIADVVVLAGMAQILWVIIFYAMKAINISILKE